MNIALIEDNLITKQYVADILAKNGFSIDAFECGEVALKNMKKTLYTLLIVDINLPGMSGYDIVSFVKRSPETYGIPKIILLTELTEQDSVNKGLKIGADDYIKKPFNDEELLLRINNLLKRDEDNNQLERVWYKNMLVNFEQSYVIENSGDKIPLTNKEREILELFVINQGLILNKEKIYMKIWNQSYKPGNKNLEGYLSKLKKKIKTLNNNLENYKNLGYCLKK